MDLVPIMVPMLLVVAAAAVVVVRAWPGRDDRRTDVVLDLRDVPTVRLADEKEGWVPEHLRHWERTGELVSAGGGSLGARMQHVAETEGQALLGEQQLPSVKTSGRLVVRRRRRRQPLVAARR